MIFITSFSTYINDFFNKLFLLLRLPKSNTTSQVGTIKQSPVSQNQGTKSTAKEQSIKTYTPYNPSIKKEPVYIDTVVPLSANAIANLRKANMSIPVSQTKQQSNQQSSTVSQTKQQSNQQSSTVSQTKQQSLTLTNQNLLVSRITPTKKKGISQIIFHRLGASSLNTSSTNKNLLRPTITPTKTKEIAQTIFRNKNNKPRIPASTIKHINTSRPESIIINKLKLTRR